MKQKMFLVAIGLFLITSSFYAGAVYGERKTNKETEMLGLGAKVSEDRSNRIKEGAARPGKREIETEGRVAGGPGIIGEITAKDQESITIKNQEGNSVIVYFSDSTMVGRAVTVSIGDLAVGQTIMAMGKAGTDGIVVAENIQIREKKE